MPNTLPTTISFLKATLEAPALQELLLHLLLHNELYIELQSEEAYANPEEALLAMAEYSGLGYESMSSFRASWRRAVKNNENPFDRASELAIDLYDSKDADLLPKKEKE